MDGDPNGHVAAYLGSLANRSPETRRTYAQHLRTLTSWCGEHDLAIEACQRGDIQRWLHARANRPGLQESTGSQYASSARRFYDWLVREGVISSNPTAGLATEQKRSQPRQGYLTLDEMRALVAASFRHPADAALVLLLTCLGLTVQEIENLDVSDYVRTGADAHLTTRTRAHSRVHRVPPLLAIAMDQIVGSQTRGPLFLTQWKTPLNRAALNRIVADVAKTAGIVPPPSSQHVASSMQHLAVLEGFSFLEVVHALGGKKAPPGPLELAAAMPAPQRPASFRMAALLRPDHDSNAALLDQADALVYADAHPAVRVMLAGAVLERHMRLLAEQHEALDRAPRKPDGTGITTWTGPLTGAKVLSTEASANAQFVADRRNEAAHGHFELINDSIAADVVDRTRRLLDAHPVAKPPAQEPVPNVPLAPRPRKRPAGVPRVAQSVRRRDGIPDQVKMYVWQRDGGKCVKCGSNMNLEYDHIIPHAMGGSDTSRNLQLLCSMCNRSKGGNIASGH